MKEILENFNDRSAQSGFNQADVQKNGILVAICYIFPLLFFVPLLIGKDSAYCRFHANQQLTLFIFAVILGLIMGVLGLIPVLGLIIDILVGLCMLAIAISFAYGAFKGMALRLPFIGHLLNIF